MSSISPGTENNETIHKGDKRPTGQENPNQEKDASPTGDGVSAPPAGEQDPDTTATDDNGTSFWRLVTVIFCLPLGLFLSTLETSIIATALVSVSANLGYFGSANWIVVSYFLTYTGFMIVYARLSDIYGRKTLLLVAFAFFGLFSLGCGLAQSMTTLIVLRAFQGMGGSGIYAMVFVVALETLPIKYFGIFSGLIGAVFASSSILGPILGGAISSGTSWRWIFLLNVPPCALIFTLLLFAYPKNAVRISEIRSLSQVDSIGLLLALSASILLVFPLEQANNAFLWSSGPVIGTLVASGVLWILFIAWELLLPRLKLFDGLPAFPLRLLHHRVLAATYLTGFLAGAPFTATIILLPQRYQIVNALSPLQAGFRMLPLLLSSALGSMLGGLSPRFKYGTYIFLVGGSAFVILGFGLMSTLGATADIPAKEYGFLVILGTGFGCSLSTLIVLSRAEVTPDDSAILMASLTQLRVLGGCIGLAIANALIAAKTSAVSALVTPAVSGAASNPAGLVGSLPLELQNTVRQAYGEAFILETRVMLGVAALGGLVALLAWNPHCRTLDEVKEERETWEREMKAKQAAQRRQQV